MSRLPLQPARRGGARHAATTAVALRLVDHARALGFRSAGLAQSRVPGSTSRHVCAVDSLARRWRIRVSYHPRPADARRPHLDLVIREGVLDLTPALDFLERVAAGEERWWDCEATGRQISPRKRKLWGRR